MNKIEDLDRTFSDKIIQFLAKYNVPVPPPFFTKHLPLFIKLFFYLLILISPLLLIKFLYPFNKKLLTLTIIAILIALAISVAGIFLGFFQLLYTF